MYPTPSRQRHDPGSHPGDCCIGVKDTGQDRIVHITHIYTNLQAQNTYLPTTATTTITGTTKNNTNDGLKDNLTTNLKHSLCTPI